MQLLCSVAVLSFFSLTNVDAQNCACNAGVDQTICSNQPLTLNGFAGAPLASPNWFEWTLISGASPVTITSPNSTTTSVTGYGAGTYIFRFRAKCTIDTAVDYLVVKVNPTPAAYAGSNITVCNTSPVTLSANTVVSPSTGTWTAPQGTFSNANSPTSAYTPVGGSTTTLTWTAAAGVCQNQSTISVTVLGGVAVDAGPNQTLSCGGNCSNLNASNPGLSPQSGFWSVKSKPSGVTNPVFSNPNSNNSQICNLFPGTYVLYWTVSGPCTNGRDSVTLVVNDINNSPNAGSGQNYFSYCNTVPSTTHNLIGQPLTAGETAKWTQSSGLTTATFTPNTDSASVVVGNLTNFNSPYVFTYTKTNSSGCVASSTHTVVHNSNISGITTPANQSLACDATAGTFSISYTDPGTATSGLNISITELSRPTGAPIASSSSQQSTSLSGTTRTDVFSVSNMLFPGIYTFRVTYSNACGTYTRTISFNISRSVNSVNAGSDILLPCFQNFGNPVGSFQMAGAPINSGTVNWSQVSGPNTATLANVHNVTLNASNLIAGTYTFRVTIDPGSTCLSKADEMLLIVPPTPVSTALATGTGKICGGTVKLKGNTPYRGETGKWTVTPSSGVSFIPNENDPNATAIGLDTSKFYTFTWTITSSCGSSSDTAGYRTTNKFGGPVANAGNDICRPAGTTSVTLTGSSPSLTPRPGSATVAWSALTTGSSVSPANTQSTTAGITGGTGVYLFQYLVSIAGCTPSADTVQVSINHSLSTVNAGADQSVCGTTVPTTATLTASTSIPSGANGLWIQYAGPLNSTISSPSSASTGLSNLYVGNYGYIFSISTGTCTPLKDTVIVNVQQAPSASNAGANISICGSAGVATYSTALAANTPTVGSGAWSVVSSPATLSFSSLTSPTATVSGLTQGTHVLRWTITSSSLVCSSSSSDVTITVTAGAYAGPDDKKCGIVSYDLYGNLGSSGTWSVISGTPAPTITAITSSYSTATNLTGTAGGNVYQFRYTLPASGSCPSTSDDIVLTVVKPPSQANAGSDQEVCWNASSTVINGNTGAPGTGTWYFESGPNTPTTSSAGGNSINVSNIVPGLYVFRYELNTDPVCVASVDRMQIMKERTASAGTNMQYCNLSSRILNANAPVINTGTWTNVSGPNTPTFNSANNPLATVSGLVPGTYQFKWTISGPGGCAANSSTVQLVNDPPITGVFAGRDTTIYINNSVQLGTTPGTVGPSGTTFAWSPAFFLNSSTIENPLFSVGNARGVYPYTETANRNTCTSVDEVIITVIGPNISGKVWDDGNGRYNGAIDGTGIGTPSGSQLYAFLILNGVIVEKATVASNGTYSFTTADNVPTYTVMISNSNGTVGSVPPANSLPGNWVYAGEQYGNSNGADTGIQTGTPNGIITVKAGNADVTNVNFGIDNRPQSDDITALSQTNPGTNVQVTVPNLTGSDLEDGNYNGTSAVRTFTVETVPSNATLYYNGMVVTAGQVIANYNPSLLKADPTFLGTGTVTFTYAWQDSAHIKDLSPNTVSMPFTGLTISGRLYDDGNGNYNGAVDGTAIGRPDGTNMFAYLTDIGTGLVIQKKTLPASGGSTGAYSFTDVNTGSQFSVTISSTNVAVGSTPPSNTLPSDWITTGESYGSGNSAGSGLESTSAPFVSDGKILVTTTTSNVPNVNFGIDKRPVSSDISAASQVNPGTNVKVTVPTLTGTDNEDGSYSGSSTVKTFFVETLPSNATLYYNGVAVTAGQKIANYNPGLLTVDPTFLGAGTVVFTYAWQDSAQAKDLTPNTVTMPFTGLTISGTMYDDGTGNYNGAVDGSAVGTPDGTQIYAYLIDVVSNQVVQVVTLPASGVNTGKYSFADANTGTQYAVYMSSTAVAIGSAPPSAANLPATWVTTGEAFGSNNSAGSGLEDNSAPFVSNGQILVTTTTFNVPNVDFGIDKQPNSDDKTAASQVNPGGTVKVPVPSLTGTDLEDGNGAGKTLPGTTNTIIIETVPANATLYYNGVAVTAGQVIGNYNSSLLTVDPAFNGAGTVVFTYAWRDSAQQKDLTPATVSLPFTDLTLSGQLFDDGDGNYDGAIDGTGIGLPDGTPLYAYLDSAGIVVRKLALPSNGQYSFSNIASTTTYTVVISGSNVALGASTPTASGLPSLWFTTGEQFGSNNTLGTGLKDPTAPFVSDGRITVTTGTSNVSNVNFGINKEPNSDNKTALSQVNPGGTVRVSVPALTGSDLEDGTLPTSLLKTVTITTVPTNATLYYNGVAVVAGQVINGYNSSLLTADPTFNGAGSVVFTYAYHDSAQAVDGTPATVTMPFTDLTLSGQLFDDGDGNYDGAIDGTGIGLPDGTPLYTYLDSAGIVVRKLALPSNGQYSFSNIASTTTYTVVISGSNVALGASTPTASSLPSLWFTTGEQFGSNNTLGTGLEDPTAPFVSDGRITVTTGTSNVSNVNFGINKEPNSDDKTALSQVNPGGTVRVSVPALTGNDLEDGTLPTSLLKTVTITTVPTNATLYYNGVAVVAGQVINGYNSSLLTVDPTFNGAGTVVFTYAWHDSAHVVDGTPATVTMPFTGLTLTGTVYHDANGLANNLVDGTGQGLYDGQQLYTYLVSAGGTILDSTRVNPLTGFYDLGNLDANTQYSVRISTQRSGTGVSQPTNVNLNQPWVVTGEQFGSGNNAGSGIESGTPNGLIAVTTTTSNVTLVDFGIEYTPWAHDKTYQLSADSVTYGSGVVNWAFYIKLNHASGSQDTTVTSNSTAVMPGTISGFDLEDGRIKGIAGKIQDKTAFVTLPDPNFSVLAYVVNGTSYVLLPSPTSSDPAWIYWNQTTGRYEIPAMNPNYLQLFMKLAYQTSMSFQYAYIDTAGLLGHVATYTINSTPLPVSVSDLNCRQQNGIVGLQWTLFDPGDADHMDIMRASDALNFNSIGTIALDDQQRNMPSVFFNYTDQHPAEGSAWYRVDVVLKNGLRIRTNLCDQHLTNVKSGVKVSLAPNPTAGITGITVESSDPTDLSISLMDNSGRLIQSIPVTMEANRILIPLNLTDLAAGLYHVQVTWSNGSKVLKLIKE